MLVNITGAIQTQLKSIKNVPKTLSILSSGGGGLAEWLAIWNVRSFGSYALRHSYWSTKGLYQFLYASVMIRDAILSFSHKSGVEVLEKVRKLPWLMDFPSLTLIARCSRVLMELLSKKWGTWSMMWSVSASTLIRSISLISARLCRWQIDWDESKIQTGRICVKSGVNGDLDELRRTYHGLPSLLVSFQSLYRHIYIRHSLTE